MRLPSAYEIYLMRMRKYYELKNEEEPAWIEKAWQYYHKLYYAKNEFSQMCSDTAIPKEAMEYLAGLHLEPWGDIPKELRKGGVHINTLLIDMYNDLMYDEDQCFINQWTLSKVGRRRMREHINGIPSATNIDPPHNEFTNVPNQVSFGNRVYSHEAEYDLTVSLAGSRIGIRNGDGTKETYIDFTERFLDEVIPMIQWEKFAKLLHKKDRSENRDDSVYQDFRTVLVDINWNEFDLDLVSPPEDNPFMQLLKLVWKEYSEEMIKRDLVLPWFKVLGWSK